MTHDRLSAAESIQELARKLDAGFEVQHFTLDCPTLKTITICGETFSIDTFRAIAKAPSGSRLRVIRPIGSACIALIPDGESAVGERIRDLEERLQAAEGRVARKTTLINSLVNELLEQAKK